MPESFELKPISIVAIPEALKKAEHYRLLNDPEQAESICLDILAIDPDNQQALVVIILAITDQFASGGGMVSPKSYLALLSDPYQREYYEGLVWERQARAVLRQPMGSSLAYDAFRSAMDCYDRALALAKPDDDQAILRWNACVRTMQRVQLRPRPVEVEQPLE